MSTRRFVIGLAALAAVAAMPQPASMQTAPKVTITLVRWPFT